VNRDDATSNAAFADQLRIEFLNLAGYRVRVAIRPGDGKHTPLLMFNGMGARLELLVPLASSLGGIETILFDVPGTGESPVPWHPYHMGMLAELTRCMLNRLGYDRVDVFGLSWGGAAAQQFALQNATRCRRLILAATTPGMPMVTAMLSTGLKLSSPKRFQSFEYARRIAGESCRGATPAVQDDWAAFGWTQHSNWFGLLLQQVAMAGWSSHTWLPLLHQPTLILAGRNDPITPVVNARMMAMLIPNSRVRVLRGGHHFFRTSLAETSTYISEFLAAADVDRGDPFAS